MRLCRPSARERSRSRPLTGGDTHARPLGTRGKKPWPQQHAKRETTIIGERTKRRGGGGGVRGGTTGGRAGGRGRGRGSDRTSGASDGGVIPPSAPGRERMCHAPAVAAWPTALRFRACQTQSRPPVHPRRHPQASHPHTSAGTQPQQRRSGRVMSAAAQQSRGGQTTGARYAARGAPARRRQEKHTRPPPLLRWPPPPTHPLRQLASPTSPNPPPPPRGIGGGPTHQYQGGGGHGRGAHRGHRCLNCR